MTIRAVFFDVGETLVDETRNWGEWADWLGVPRFTFFAVLGAVIGRGEHHTRVFEVFRPGFDLAAERARRESEGVPDTYLKDDLYPDVRGCMRTLRAGGYRLGLAGNHSAETGEALLHWSVPADVVASALEWDAAKPSPAFFEKLIALSGVPAGEIVYVGDRVDNDVLPANRAGLRTVFIRRGPWGNIQAEWPEANLADLRIDSLAEFPDGLARL